VFLLHIGNSFFAHSKNSYFDGLGGFAGFCLITGSFGGTYPALLFPDFSGVGFGFCVIALSFTSCYLCFPCLGKQASVPSMVVMLVVWVEHSLL
jgi:hypothetical protein